MWVGHHAQKTSAFVILTSALPCFCSIYHQVFVLTFLEDGSLSRACQGSCLLVERLTVRALGLLRIQLCRLLLQDFTDQQLYVKGREHSH
jgi:hypothetical protein